MVAVHALQSFGSPWLDGPMLAITQLGSEFAYVGLLLIVYIGIDARAGRTIALAFLASVFLNEQIKLIVDRPRPFQLDPDVLRSQAAFETAPGSSFPSGHAQAATVFYGMASAYLRRWWMTTLAVVLVLALSLSRVYLGVHFPVDVLGGIGIGLCVVAVALVLDASRLQAPRLLTWLLGIGVPLALQLLRPTENSGVALGAMAAFITGPSVFRYEARGGLVRRALLVIIGLVVVLGAQLTVSATVPDAIRHSPAGSFARYLMLGYLGTLFVPWLGRALRLTPDRDTGGADLAAHGE